VDGHRDERILSRPTSLRRQHPHRRADRLRHRIPRRGRDSPRRRRRRRTHHSRDDLGRRRDRHGRGRRSLRRRARVHGPHHGRAHRFEAGRVTPARETPPTARDAARQTRMRLRTLRANDSGSRRARLFAPHLRARQRPNVRDGPDRRDQADRRAGGRSTREQERRQRHDGMTGVAERILVVDLAAKSKNWALTPEGERRIREATPPGWRVNIVQAPTSSDGDGPPRPNDEVMAAVSDAEIYFGFGIPRLLFLEAKKLRWVHSAAAGVGSALYDEMVSSDVLFTNSAGIHAVPIAEYCVAGVLHFLRGLDFALDQQRRSEWNKAPFVALDSVLREVDTVRALIVGVGGLGGATGERLAALGAHCTGVRRRVELGPPPGFERVISLDEFEAELPKHNVVVLAAPLTEATKGLLTRERLQLLSPDTIVVNVARGAMIDEDALAE